MELDVQHERGLAEALLQIRELYTRVRLSFPTLSAAEVITLSGIVEQAVSSRLPVQTIKLPELAVKVREPKRLPAPTGGRRPEIVDAILIVLGNKDMRGREIHQQLKERHWMPKTANPTRYISQVLASNPKHFKRVSLGLYRARKAPQSAPVQRVHIDELRAKLLRAFASTQTSTTAELCKLLSINDGRRLTPHLVSLMDYGAINKTTKDGVAQWSVNKDRLEKYDLEKAVNAFSNGHAKLLEAAPA